MENGIFLSSVALSREWFIKSKHTETLNRFTVTCTVSLCVTCSIMDVIFLDSLEAVNDTRSLVN